MCGTQVQDGKQLDYLMIDDNNHNVWYDMSPDNEGMVPKRPRRISEELVGSHVSRAFARAGSPAGITWCMPGIPTDR